MLLMAALMVAMHLKEVLPASAPIPVGCVAPTLDDARAHMSVTVKATLTGRLVDGTLIADQLLEQRACRHRLNMFMKGPRPDFDRLRTLFEQAIERSESGHIFVVSVTLSGTVSEALLPLERHGPAEVSLDVESISDAAIVEVFVR